VAGAYAGAIAKASAGLEVEHAADKVSGPDPRASLEAAVLRGTPMPRRGWSTR
jgi:hypothetical protein